MLKRIALLVVAVAALAATSGCAGTVESWIVRTRDHQGDRALAMRNLKDAALAYRLALDIDPHDAHARAGAISVQRELAEDAYRNGKLEEAINYLSGALKIAPKDPSIIDLQQQLSQARLKREIVISNYPAYKAAGLDLVRSYVQLRALNDSIVTSLKRFEYSYDTVDITKAIENSYELAGDVTRNTARLSRFRQIVETGTGEPQGERLAQPSSLLPLP
ncbi:MAG: tetratricopeptide repeat protein [Candidatus Eremiobacteraeota bacterium]|nr:tetratricopeptide repeat protein [Candidatus Eremiobacteraeota bacterium]